MGKSLDRKIKPSRIRAIVTNGATGMPSYSERISGSDLDALVQYLTRSPAK